MYYWLIANALFGGVLVAITTGQNVTTINNGDITFLDGFALFVAGLIIFKFIFALIYVTKWNFRQWTNPYYRKAKIDMNQEFKRIRRDKNGAYSTDEDEDDEEGNIFGKKEEVGESGHIF